MSKLSQDAAQIVFDEISRQRGPSDRIQAVIRMCLEAGAEAGGVKPAPPPPAPTPPVLPKTSRRRGRAPADNAAGEGAITTDAD